MALKSRYLSAATAAVLTTSLLAAPAFAETAPEQTGVEGDRKSSCRERV